MSPCSSCVKGSLRRLPFEHRFNIGMIKVIEKRQEVCVPRDSRYVCPRSGLVIINASNRLRGFHSRLSVQRSFPSRGGIQRRIALRSFAMSRRSPLLGGDVTRSQLKGRCSDLVITVRQRSRLVSVGRDAIFHLKSLM